MTDDPTIEEIKQRKLEELQNRVDGPGDDTGGSESGAAGPAEPIPIHSVSDLDNTAERYDVVLADFYADWCGPCRMLEPTVERIARETDAAVAKIDIDANQQLAASYGVRSVPTLVLFAGGEPAQQLVGVQDESRLRELIEQHATA